MEEKRADTKPLSFIGKSEIAQKAETAEAGYYSRGDAGSSRLPARSISTG